MKERNVAAPLLCSQRHLAAAGPKALWKAPRMVFCLCATNSSPSPAAGCMLCVIVRVDWVQEASLCCFLRRRVGKCPEYSLSVISIVSGWSKENIWVALSLTSDITPYVDQLYVLIWGPREGIKPHTHTHTPLGLSPLAWRYNFLATNTWLNYELSLFLTKFSPYSSNWIQRQKAISEWWYLGLSWTSAPLAKKDDSY